MNSRFFRPDHYEKYPITLKSASGSTLVDLEDREYLDLFSVMGAVSCGHSIPEINEALAEQVGKLWGSSFFPTDTQLRAIAMIDAVLPEALQVAALYSTGAEAVDHAIRIARAATGRQRVLSFRDHFHGKTHGTLFLVRSYPDCYGPTPEAYRTVVNSDGSEEPADLEEQLHQAFAEDVAALIFEPVIGYSGPRRLHDRFLETVRKFCDQNGIIMIADEILCGLQRCDGWFVSCRDSIVPDILVFGKGLGNGYPISGVACVDGYSGILKQTLPGSTFAANSLGCAVACAVLAYMRQPGFTVRSGRLERAFFDYFSQKQFESLGLTLDGMGGLLSLSFRDPPPGGMQETYLRILRKGVITSHSNTHLRIMPPLTIEMREFERGLEIVGASLPG